MKSLEEFLADWPNARWGPAHIVLEDGNILDEDIDACMRLIEAILAKRRGKKLPKLTVQDKKLLDELNWYEGKDGNETAELVATLAYLKEYRKLSVDERGELG